MSINTTSRRIGENIETDELLVTGGIRMSSGGDSPVVDARWGRIQGDIENQEDLIDLFDAVGEEIDGIVAELANKADASDLTALSDTVDTKLTTPSGTNGQFLSLVDGVWTAVNLPVYEGGVE